MLARKCCASSTHTLRGHLSSRTSHSTRWVRVVEGCHAALLTRMQLQAMQKAQAQALSQASSPTQPPIAPQTGGQQSQGISPSPTGQHPFAMSNPTALAYAAQQMTLPQMNMNMGMGMGMGMGMNPMMMNMATPFANPQAMQSVMRNNPSPGPMPVGSQNFMNLNGMQGF